VIRSSVTELSAPEAEEPSPSAGTRRSPVVAVLHGVLAILATQPITWAASLLATVFVPRYLTDRELGQYAVAVTIAGLAGTLVALGIPTSLVRAVANRPWDAKREGTAALALVVGLSSVTAIGVALVWSWWELPGSEGGILPVVLLGMVVSNGLQIAFSILVGLEQHARFAWMNAASSAISQAASVGALVAGASLVEYVAVGVVVQVVVALLAWRLANLGLEWAGLQRARLRRIAVEGLPFLGSLMMGRLRGDIEIALLAFLLTEQVVGWWSAASRIVSAPIFIPILVAIPLLPALSQSAGDRPLFERTLRRSLLMVVLVTVPLGAMIGAVAPAIPGRLGWAASFEGAVPVIVMLSASMPLIAIGIVLGTAMIALGLERQLLAVNIAATVVSAAAIPVLIWALGGWTDSGVLGAGIARLLTESVMIVGAACFLPRGLLDWDTLRVLGGTVLSAACLVAVTRTLLPISPELAGIAGGLAFSLCALLLGAVQVRDLRELRSMVLDLLRKRGLLSR
jgi:O-antigen/teichoic acid export membrane protein